MGTTAVMTKTLMKTTSTMVPDGVPTNFNSPSCKHGKPVKSSSNYLYFCECIDDQQLVNTHRVVVRKHSKLCGHINYLLSLILVLGLSYSIIFSVIAVAVSLQWLILILGAVSLMRQRNAVAEEAVVVMPTFGVQLETSYCSGKVLRQFVPLKQMLAAVINEAVTPTSCYYYLALLLRDDSKLVLAFKGIGDNWKRGSILDEIYWVNRSRKKRIKLGLDSIYKFGEPP